MLDSWREGNAKSAILEFVESVTSSHSEHFLEPPERVAVFDNDGTLWCEKPVPIQADFLLQKVARMAEEDPALREHQPWKAVAARDYDWLSGALTKHHLGDDRDLETITRGLLKASDAASVEELEAASAAFLARARHPLLGRPYHLCVYQPMIELLRQLQASGFTSYLVTGGGRDFMRPVTGELYGIGPERVIGSALALEYRDGAYATIVQRPALEVFDDGPSKPVRIWARTGRRPVLAAGNANGDIPMLRFCGRPGRPSLALLLSHDDDRREYYYRTGAEEALERARRSGWTVVSMKEDWKTIFP